MKILYINNTRRYIKKEKIMEPLELSIIPGMSVQTVKSKGNTAQSTAAHLFDYNNNGRLDKYEAKEFNSYNIMIKEHPTEKNAKQLSLTKKYDNESSILIGYKDEEDLKNLRIEYDKKFHNKDSYIRGGCGTITYDTFTNNYTVENMKYHGEIKVVKANSLKVKNSDIINIVAKETDSVIIDNTCNKIPIFPDAPTIVILDKTKTTYYSENNSKTFTKYDR